MAHGGKVEGPVVPVWLLDLLESELASKSLDDPKDRLAVAKAISVELDARYVPRKHHTR